MKEIDTLTTTFSQYTITQPGPSDIVLVGLTPRKMETHHGGSFVRYPKFFLKREEDA